MYMQQQKDSTFELTQADLHLFSNCYKPTFSPHLSIFKYEINHPIKMTSKQFRNKNRKANFKTWLIFLTTFHDGHVVAPQH